MPIRKKLKLRSGLEELVVQALLNEQLLFEYEPFKITYQKKPSKYTPDLLLENGILVEVKGYFDADDRAKHLLIKEQHPNLDIRFVFQNSKKKIHKSSNTTYGDWCHAHGFLFADKEIPYEWTQEPGNRDQVRTYQKPRLRSTARKNPSRPISRGGRPT